MSSTMYTVRRHNHEFPVVCTQGSSDQMSRCGIVTGIRRIVQSLGFLVDFGFPHKPMKTWISLNEIDVICCYDNQPPGYNYNNLLNDRRNEGLPVQVFTRLTPSGPPNWRLGKLRLTGFGVCIDSCGFATVSLDATLVLLALPGNCIRLPCITYATYQEKLNLYEEIRSTKWSMKDVWDEYLLSKNQLSLSTLKSRPAQWRKLRFARRKSHTEKTTRWYYSPAARLKGIQFLPNEIMTEVLGCLDTPRQSVLRRVCSSWNVLLTSLPAVTRLLCFRESCRYADVACLLACWRPMIVFAHFRISGFQDGRRTIVDGRFLQQVVIAGSYVRPATILLANVCWKLYECSYYQEVRLHPRGLMLAFFTELSAIAAVCETLVIKDCSVIDEYDIDNISTPCAPGYVKWTWTCQLRIYAARIKSVCDYETWWNWLDHCCPTLTLSELQSLSSYITCWQLMDTRSDPVNFRRKSQLIYTVLYEFQRMDPRASNPYGQLSREQWKTTNLNFAKLNKLTLHTLRTVQLLPQTNPCVNLIININLNLMKMISDEIQL
ncbi:uncharacterized protein LOC129582275 [Paramacrobiotus metropolitanus]|uniref:uncharacterized protein LOC129582275 n=1 Tax=Paramacrobiotus metropolitanus TaxID=2943436 RepID=UPI002445B529|nr:uncharacterized protein LOC129582275 [Paramacrobiotus metropolitanus]